MGRLAALWLARGHLPGSLPVTLFSAVN